MSQTAQAKNSNTIAGFTTVQAYTLAVITLVIGIAVGYFARGSASPSTAPETTLAAAPATSGAGGMGMSPAQLPGIGSGQRQQAPSPEMLAKAAEPLLTQLQSNPNDAETGCTCDANHDDRLSSVGLDHSGIGFLPDVGFECRRTSRTFIQLRNPCCRPGAPQ